VDENLASLNAGQRVWERELTAIRKALVDIDFLLRGDPTKDTDGIVARIHKQENDVNLLRAVLLKDATGGRGLVGRVEVLETGERRASDYWKFATASIVAIISLLGLVLTNLDHIESFLGEKRKDPLGQMIDRSKRPRYHRYILPDEENE
jgi:uncharacterized protein HemX